MTIIKLTDALCHSRCGTLRNPHCSMAVGAEHRSKFAALHRQWWRLQMSEKFSSGTKNLIQTITYVISAIYNKARLKCYVLDKIDNVATLLWTVRHCNMASGLSVFELSPMWILTKVWPQQNETLRSTLYGHSRPTRQSVGSLRT